MARRPNRRPPDVRAEDRRRDDARDQQVGPGPAAIESALKHLLKHEIPGQPKVGAVGVLRDSVGFPISVGDREIKSAHIQKGRPDHGALRSDDHISRYTVEFPKDCPECGSQRAVYKFGTNHNIAGGESIDCRFCDHTHHEKNWG